MWTRVIQNVTFSVLRTDLLVIVDHGPEKHADFFPEVLVTSLNPDTVSLQTKFYENTKEYKGNLKTSSGQLG